MNRRRFIALTSTLACLDGTGCTRRNRLRTIRVSANPYFTMSGLYLAQELGCFAGLGLEVEVQQIAHAPQAIALAAGGALDVVFTSASASMVNAIAKGARLRIVAGREIAAPDCSDLGTLYGRRVVFPGGLRDIRLLRGKRVASNLDAGNAEFCIDMILASAGMTVEDLGVLKMARSESVPALLSGRIDAIFLSDFNRRYAEVADQIVRGLTLADVLPNHQVSFILFGSTLLDGNPDTGRKFLSAYLRGASDYLGGKTPRFHDELAVSNGIDPILARKACRNSFVPDGRIDLASLERFVQWAVAKGFCQIPIKASHLVDMNFLETQKQLVSCKGETGPTRACQFTEVSGL